VANPNKTAMLLVGKATAASKASWDKFNIVCGTTVIRSSNSIRLLGVQIDRELKLEEHTSLIVKKIGYATRLAALTARFLPVSVRTNFMTSYIIPHADYCGVLLLSTTAAQMTRIEKALFRSHRALKNNKVAVQAVIEKLKIRLIIRAMLIFHSAVHKHSTTRLSESIEIIQNSSRSHLPVRIPLAKTSFMTKSLLVQCSRCWNRLPKDANSAKDNEQYRKMEGFLNGMETKQLIKCWNGQL
jgi:hypothetical protein